MSAPATLKQTRKLLDLIGDISGERLQMLLANGDLLKQMLDVDLNLVDREAYASLMAVAAVKFQSPQEVFDAFYHWAQRRGWPIPASTYMELGSSLPKTYQSTLSSVLSLDIWLGNLHTTMKELWLWVGNTHGAFWKEDSLDLGSEQLVLEKPDAYGDTPSVKWVTIDLNSHRDRSPTGWTNTRFAGPELLAAAALHPRWLPSINGRSVPAVVLNSLRWLDLSSARKRQYALFLDWEKSHPGANLALRYDNSRYKEHALPVVKEL